MKHSWRVSGALLAAIALQAAPVWAQKGDAEAGRIKASTCVGCHGIKDYSNVYPTYRVPTIAGQHEAYLTAALKAYREGQRKHPTMNAQAGSMSDQDIADIAAYLAKGGDKE
ncbi:MAG: cytochrome C [Salinisphaeraceae bacterium]|jgi:cytochrome c553|nr:cytochrome C [Salinisphaeraceae bacterium]